VLAIVEIESLVGMALTEEVEVRSMMTMGGERVMDWPLRVRALYEARWKLSISLASGELGSCSTLNCDDWRRKAGRVGCADGGERSASGDSGPEKLCGVEGECEEKEFSSAGLLVSLSSSSRSMTMPASEAERGDEGESIVGERGVAHERGRSADGAVGAEQASLASEKRRGEARMESGRSERADEARSGVGRGADGRFQERTWLRSTAGSCCSRNGAGVLV
jgi:hypothetical protein